MGFIILSKKLLSVGARLLRGGAFCEVCNAALGAGPNDAREVGFAEEVGFGRDAIEDFMLLVGAALLGIGSCFAREDAVGAVRWEEMFIGFVTSRFFGAADGEVFSEADFSALAMDAAVGAVSELLLGFLAGIFEGAVACADFGVRGDVTALVDGFDVALVDIAAGLPFVFGSLAGC